MHRVRSTGRVAVELARRGYEVAGVDIDDEMISGARAKAPELGWHQLALATFDLGSETFDAVVMAGNVLLFTGPWALRGFCSGSLRPAHLSLGGALVAGFQLRGGGYSAGDKRVRRRLRGEHGFGSVGVVLDLGATGIPWTGGDYAVSVHPPLIRDAVRGARLGGSAIEGPFSADQSGAEFVRTDQPQHSMVWSTLSPHLCLVPAEMSMNAPEGGSL